MLYALLIYDCQIADQMSKFTIIVEGFTIALLEYKRVTYKCLDEARLLLSERMDGEE